MYDFLEHRLDGRTWLMGEDFTMADCAAGPALLYAGDLFPVCRTPRDCRLLGAAAHAPVLCTGAGGS